MAIRYLKVLLVTIVGALATLYGLQNVVNIEAAFQVVSIVMKMEGHNYYPASLGPAVHSPILVWLALATIIGLELTAGVLAFKGAWDLWVARSGPAAGFNASKTFALLGCGLGVVVWLGLFHVIGGAYFQMWQTELGANSLEGAFQYFTACGIVLLFVNMPDH